MDFLSILTILDADLRRETVSLKNDKEVCSWTSDELFNVTVTVDNEESDFLDVHRICLVNKSDSIFVYLNYNNRFKYSKLDLTDVSVFSIS